MYWNSRNIPELAGLNFRQRMQVLRHAADKLSTPYKLLLNLIKLVLLVPPFMMIARAESTLEFIGWVMLLLVLYPLITRPLTFYLVQPQLKAARRQFE